MISQRPLSAAEALFGAASRFIRRPAPASGGARRAYAEQVLPLARRVGSSYGEWLGRTRELHNGEALANAASRMRWEIASAAEILAAMELPADVASAHRQLVAAIRDAARAAQLLSRGYRATSYAAVCDGQALLISAHERLQPLLEQLERWAEVKEQTAAQERREARLRAS